MDGKDGIIPRCFVFRRPIYTKKPIPKIQPNFIFLFWCHSFFLSNRILGGVALQNFGGVPTLMGLPIVWIPYWADSHAGFLRQFPPFKIEKTIPFTTYEHDAVLNPVADSCSFGFFRFTSATSDLISFVTVFDNLTCICTDYAPCVPRRQQLFRFIFAIGWPLIHAP